MSANIPEVKYPITFSQRLLGGQTRWVMLESANKGFEVVESPSAMPPPLTTLLPKEKDKLPKIDDSCRVFTKKGMVRFWLDQIKRDGTMKMCRPIDFMAAYYRVQNKTFPAEMAKKLNHV